MTPAPVTSCQNGTVSREAAAPSRGLAGKLRRLTLFGAVAGALWGGGGAGCDSGQYVLVTVQNLPMGSTVSVRTTYTLDGKPGREGIADVTAPTGQFAFSFPNTTRGAFTASVQANSYVSPAECYSSSATGSLMLSGSYKQDLPVALPAATLTPCDATQVPVNLPLTDSAPIASWGDSASNIWLVGDKGLILHWDGKFFRQISLPSDLQLSPPVWRAVSGVGSGYVWIAGDNGVVARWDGSTLKTVPLMAAGGGTFVSGPGGLPSWVSVSVSNQGTDDVFFASSNGYIGRNVVGSGVQPIAMASTYPVYPVMASPMTSPMSATVSFNDVFCITAGECWFVGYDPNAFPSGGQSGAGTIIQAYFNLGAFKYVYSDYSMSHVSPNGPVTRSRLRGVWGKFINSTRQLYLVGENGTVLFSNNSLNTIGVTEPSLYPKFQTDYSPVATMALMGKSLQLNAIGGTSPTDLWIAGDQGLLMRWDPTPFPPGNPFTGVRTGLTANLRSVFSTGPSNTGGRVYVSGDQQTFAAP